MPFVPDDFEAPDGLWLSGMRLEPLGAEHNERDHEAWSSSIDHIRATPGFTASDADDDGDTPWPRPMSLEENLRDLQRHAADFAARRGFTYSVLDPDTDEVIRASRAELDSALVHAVSDWLDSDWPFSHVDYRSS
jgi:hypothetical protein